MWKRSAIFYLFCTVAMALALQTGCGSKQRVEEREVGPPPSFDCLSDRWAEPPPNVGETPPDQSPSMRDIDPFLDEPSQD